MDWRKLVCVESTMLYFGRICIECDLFHGNPNLFTFYVCETVNDYLNFILLTSLYTMVESVNVLLQESDIIRLILEYLSSHGLMISLLTLEHESGIVNGMYSEEGHFLRRLVLDGQWRDVLSFIQPLSTIPAFDMKQLLYLIHKQRYLEMLSVKSELHPENHDALVDEMVKCADGLEKLCPSKTDYDSLCVLLTLSNLSDHVDYKQWNLLSARVKCFENIYSLIAEFLPFEKCSSTANCVVSADRLIHLLVKGLLYESCSEFCFSQATASNYAFEEQAISSLLKTASLTDSDLCLVSWLSALPSEVFCYSFDRKSLNLKMKALVQPEIQWTDHLRNPLNSKVLSLSSLGSSDLKSFGLGFEKKKNDDAKPCQEYLPSGSSSLLSGVSKSFKLFKDDRSMVNTSIDQLFETNEGSSLKKTMPSRQSSLQQNPKGEKIAVNISEKDSAREQLVQSHCSQKHLDKTARKNDEKTCTESNRFVKNKDWDKVKGMPITMQF